MRQTIPIVYYFCRCLFFLGFMRERGEFRSGFCSGTRKKKLKFFPQIYFLNHGMRGNHGIIFNAKNEKFFCGSVDPWEVFIRDLGFETRDCERRERLFHCAAITPGCKCVVCAARFCFVRYPQAPLALLTSHGITEVKHLRCFEFPEKKDYPVIDCILNNFL